MALDTKQGRLSYSHGRTVRSCPAVVSDPRAYWDEQPLRTLHHAELDLAGGRGSGQQPGLPGPQERPRNAKELV
jgi:hypothetical protein